MSEKRRRIEISSPVSEHINRFNPDLSSHRILLLDNNSPHWSVLLDNNSPNWSVEPPDPFRSVVRCMSTSLIIVGSINGLICTARFNVEESAGDMMILNPVTRHFIKLPPPSSPLNEMCGDRVTYAFWWDSSDYKVVRIFSRLGLWDYQAEEWINNNPYNSNNPICAEFWVSSSPDKWTDIPIDFNRPFYHIHHAFSTACDIIVEGVAYWIVIEKHNKGKFVLSLDMATLVWKQISLPEQSMKPSFFIGKNSCVSNNVSFFAANWKGVFALVERNEANHLFTVWTKKDSSEGEWRNCTSFHLHLDIQCLSFLNFFNGKIPLLTFEGQITLLDLETQALEDLEDVGCDSCIISIHDFVGSFVSIKGFEPESESNIGHPLLTFIWPDPVSMAKTKDSMKKKNLVVPDTSYSSDEVHNRNRLRRKLHPRRDVINKERKLTQKKLYDFQGEGQRRCQNRGIDHRDRD